MKQLFITKIFFAICAPLALFGAENFLSLSEIEDFQAAFSAELRKISTPEMIFDGAFCAVNAGNTVLIAKNFHNDTNTLKALPLGRSSLPLISLLALEMAEKGKIPQNSLSAWRKNFQNSPIVLASSICSLYNDKGEKTLLSDFFDMRAKIPPHADSLIPADASEEELFSILSTLEKYPIPEKFSRDDFSAASASLGAYILAYSKEKNSRNLKENFRKISDEFLCVPLGFSKRRFVALKFSRDKISPALEPAYAFALPIEDIAKWLECETSQEPKISNVEAIKQRRGGHCFLGNSEKGDVKSFSAGWICAEDLGVRFFMSHDVFRGCANIVAIFPHSNSAVAIIVQERSKSSSREKSNARAAELCAKTFGKFLKALVKSASTPAF